MIARFEAGADFTHFLTVSLDGCSSFDPVCRHHPHPLLVHMATGVDSVVDFLSDIAAFCETDCPIQELLSKLGGKCLFVDVLTHSRHPSDQGISSIFFGFWTRRSDWFISFTIPG